MLKFALADLLLGPIGIAMKSLTIKLAVTGIFASLLFAQHAKAEPVQIQDSNVGQSPQSARDGVERRCGSD